ncbi:histidine phosphatase family protein [Bdellovibrio sp. BCCA]|uniref:histidine phosphatase family protein n=1 Tax=Bdellovibrio sp. BCCA TaxID=3136281 RepID=UPI0030F2B3FD
MGLPSKITLIRHGESEANIFNRLLDSGKIKSAPDFVKRTPDREVKLTPVGVKQAKETGLALKRDQQADIDRLSFDYIVCSDHTRAKETMGHILIEAGMTSAEVSIDPLIGERNWGDVLELSSEQRAHVKKMRKIDPYNSCMPNGEHILITKLRARTLIERLVRGGYENVLIVSHGEFIESFISEICKMRTEKFKEFFHDSQVGDIKNCQVITVLSEGGKAKKIHSRNFFYGIDHGEIGIPKEKMTPSDLLAETAKVQGFLDKIPEANQEEEA